MENKPWQGAIEAILENFFVNEGATFLFNRHEQQAIVEQVDPSIREELAQVLRDWHDRKLAEAGRA